jgi:hypothetical protein
MTFSLSLTAPGINELSLTATSLYLEIARLGIFLSIWDRYAGCPWVGISKHATGKGLEVRIGPVLLSVGVSQPVAYVALQAV